MPEEHQEPPHTVEAAQERIVVLFGELCANPDSVPVAVAADEALEALDRLLVMLAR